MASSSTNQNTGAAASSSSGTKSTNEPWSYKDYLTVRILVDEYFELHQDIKQHHLSAIFAEVCPHKKVYESYRLYGDKTTSKNTSVAKAKQRAWRRNEFSGMEFPGEDYDLWVEIKTAINNSAAFKAVQAGQADTEDCGQLHEEDAEAAGEGEDDEE